MKIRALAVLSGLFFCFVSNTVLGQIQTPHTNEVAGSNYLAVLFDLSFRIDTTRYLPAVEEPAPIDPDDYWKTWTVIENYTFNKDRGNIPMIADLKALHPYFRDKIITLIQRCQEKGIELRVVESYRTHAKQSEYFGMGRKYTRSKGGKSKHQYGLAVDLVPIVNDQAQWDSLALWKKIGTTGESLGLRWGGRWKAPYDPAHFEWSGGVTTTHLNAGTFPAVPKKEHYPCLQEDLEFLVKSWELWEAEQSSIARSSRQSTAAAGQ